MSFPPSSVDKTHLDYERLSYIRDEIFKRVGGQERLIGRLPSLIKDAVDFVLDPVRTARTHVSELDRVEKTFIGLKIEHYLRDLLDVPKGLKRDIRIGDVDVDIKNTISSSWMIPPESYRDEDPCLLIATAKFDGRCWLGLVIARPSYLNAPNRDHKRSVSDFGKRQIMWLVEGQSYPPSRWASIDMDEFRTLRKIRGGSKRAAEFFRKNLGKVIHRSIIESLLHDQFDYMKRLRGNGGARDYLIEEGIALLSGAYDALEARNYGKNLAKDEFVAIRIDQSG